MVSTSKRRTWFRWMFAAVIVFVVPRFFFVLNEVRGPSMWPLFNDGGTTEWVLTLRSFWDRNPEVNDVVVVRDPENADRFVVKRIAALEGEVPHLSNGDLRVRARDLSSEWYFRRQLEDVQETRAPLWSLQDLRWHRHDARIEDALGRSALKCEIGRCALDDHGSGWFRMDPTDEDEGEVRVPGDAFFDDHQAANGRIVGGRNPVHDFITTFKMEDPGPVAVRTLSLQYHLGTKAGVPNAELRLSVSPDHWRVIVSGDSPVAQAFTFPRAEVPTIRWTLVDDLEAVEVWFDDEKTRRQTWQIRRRRPPTAGKKNHLKLCYKGGSVILSRLDIDRDMHYTPPSDRARTDSSDVLSTSFRVETGQYFLLGDNSPVSRDSRHWRGTRPHQIVGRPRFVVWPLERMRALH